MSDGSLKEVKTMENSNTVILKNGRGRLRGGVCLRELPTLRVRVRTFWYFGYLLMGGSRLREVVAHGGWTVF